MCEKTTFNYSKLRGKIIEKYGTQGKFADVINMSDRSMSLKLNNGIGLSQEEILNWCKLLDINEMEIPTYFFNLEVSKMKHIQEAT